MRNQCLKLLCEIYCATARDIRENVICHNKSKSGSVTVRFSKFFKISHVNQLNRTEEEHIQIFIDGSVREKFLTLQLLIKTTTYYNDTRDSPNFPNVIQSFHNNHLWLEEEP